MSQRITFTPSPPSQDSPQFPGPSNHTGLSPPRVFNKASDIDPSTISPKGSSVRDKMNDHVKDRAHFYVENKGEVFKQNIVGQEAEEAVAALYKAAVAKDNPAAQWVQKNNTAPQRKKGGQMVQKNTKRARKVVKVAGKVGGPQTKAAAVVIDRGLAGVEIITDRAINYDEAREKRKAEEEWREAKEERRKAEQEKNRIQQEKRKLHSSVFNENYQGDGKQYVNIFAPGGNPGNGQSKFPMQPEHRRIPFSDPDFDWEKRYV